MDRHIGNDSREVLALEQPFGSMGPAAPCASYEPSCRLPAIGTTDLPDTSGGRAPRSIIRIRFGAFTLMRLSESSGDVFKARSGWASDDLWVIRLSQVSIGDSTGYGLPELINSSADAALCGPHASLPRLVLTFPASSVAEIVANETESVPLTGACGALVRNHLMLLSSILPLARKGDIPIIAEATAALLSTCLARGHRPDAQGKDAEPSVLRAEVERVIRRNISSARLSPARICTLVGLSRSALYRLFCDAGGVARNIRSLRLEMIREDLADPALTDKSIAEIARLRGLHCASSFNRSFRQTFGQTPSEVRAMGLKLNPLPGYTAHAPKETPVDETVLPRLRAVRPT